MINMEYFRRVFQSSLENCIALNKEKSEPVIELMEQS